MTTPGDRVLGAASEAGEDWAERDRVWRRRRRRRLTWIVAVVCSVFSVVVVIVGVPVVRISTAVPGGNDDSVRQVHDLIERYQRPEADPARGNAHFITLEMLDERRRIRDRLTLELQNEIDSDEDLALAYPSSNASVSFIFAIEDASDLEPGDYGFEYADQINEMHRRYAERMIEELATGRASELLDEVADTWYARREQTPGRLLDTALWELGEARAVAQVNMLLARRAVERGDVDEFVRRVDQTLALARVFGHQPTLIERLVAVAIQAITLDTIVEYVIAGQPSPQVMQRLSEAMDRQLPVPTVSLALEGERLWVVDLVHRVHSDDGRGSGYRLPVESGDLAAQGGVRSPTVANVPGLFMPHKRETLALIDELFQEAIGQSEVPPRERRFDLFAEHVAGSSATNQIVSLLMPAFDAALNSVDQADAKAGGVRIMVAIERYRSDRGSLPGTLSELVPEYLVRLPVDPFSSDGTFGYSLREATASGRLEYTLYSFAFDGVDNNGVGLDVERDLAFKPLERGNEAGVDFVFNRIDTDN